ncbi:rhodanese-like domain-containing protein [Flavobacterium sp. CYK-4]|uniref:rhodanese-like domain-containing protein n=1 Tax=Flavobacterium lotistagni TaxID=2709660 RepID=UPI00140D72EF|nr:rhodanese-like domain-containing protein [Flavobacterium lotistagni]NHM07584.1 rhodanese-like domain-containing protein [Flavobacterium lotistagni]
MGFFSSIFGNKSNNEDLAQKVSQGAFLVDVRSGAEFASGHVKGSVNIPLDQLTRNLAKLKGKEHIVVFCRSGNRSAQAKMILNQNGFNNITNGGTWQNIAALVQQ